MKHWISLLALTVFVSGCATMKDGGGPVSRQKAMEIAGHQFAPATAQQKQAFADMEHKKWSRSYKSMMPRCGKNDLKKSRKKSDMGFWDIFGCGFCTTHTNFIEDPEGTANEDLCWEEALCVPGYPLIWPLWFDDIDVYLKSSGEQVGKNNFFGIGLGGLLYTDLERINPVSNDIKNGTVPEQYNAFDGWFLAAGLVGGGRMNNIYYGQLLWIAFPVGSAN